MRLFKGLTLILMVLSAACVKKADSDPYACNSSIPGSNGKPTILIIGDSISIGYTPFIKAALGNYDVQHNPCNAYSSTLTKERVMNWLDSRPSFQAITFNNGIWDVSAYLHTTRDEYRDNITSIAQAIKTKTQHPLFVLTTTIPQGAVDLDPDSEVIARNAIAIQVMALYNIPVLDLYSVSLTLNGDHLAPNNVHYTSFGYEILGNDVLTSLNTNFGVH